MPVPQAPASPGPVREAGLGPHRIAPRQAVVVAVAAQGVTIVGIVLLGTMAVSIRRDLGFDERVLGVCLALCFGVAAGFSVFSGRLVQRLGAAWGVRLATVTAALGMVGVTWLARSWVTILPSLLAIGLAIAIVQPATDLLLIQNVPLRRQGMAFGLKQTAGGPAIGLVAGLAVPAVAAALGWRAAFALGAAACLVVALAVPGLSTSRRRTPLPRAADGPFPIRSLRVLALAGGLATAAQSAFVAFAVSAAVAAGLSEGVAALVFAAGSALGMAVRIVGGLLADRHRGGLLVAIATMLLLSAVGFALLSTERRGAMLIGIPLLCATVWGWPGLYFLAIARSSPLASARASGIAAAGALTGGVLGPLAFGFLARRDYTVGWGMLGLCAVVGALTILLGRSLLRRELTGSASHAARTSS